MGVAKGGRVTLGKGKIRMGHSPQTHGAERVVSLGIRRGPGGNGRFFQPNYLLSAADLM